MLAARFSIISGFALASAFSPFPTLLSCVRGGSVFAYPKKSPRPANSCRFASMSTHNGIAIFDATNTLMCLAEPVGNTYSRIAAKHSLTVQGNSDWIEARFRAEYAKMKPLDYTVLKGPVGVIEAAEKEWWHQLVRNVLGCQDESKAFDAYFAECFEHFSRGDAWKLYDEVPNTLTTLQQDGWTIGVLSNFDLRLRRVLDECVMHWSKFVILPSDAGASKPNPRIFQTALVAAVSTLGGVPPKRCMYVGDSVALDAQGAASAGLVPVLVDRKGKWQRDVPFEGCHVVQDLAGVVRVGKQILEAPANK